MSTLIFILKKVHRFLQYEMEEKKMIEVHAVNKKKKKNDWCAHCKPKKVKKVHKFLQYERKRNNWCACCKQKKQRK